MTWRLLCNVVTFHEPLSMLSDTFLLLTRVRTTLNQSTCTSSITLYQLFCCCRSVQTMPCNCIQGSCYTSLIPKSYFLIKIKERAVFHVTLAVVFVSPPFCTQKWRKDWFGEWHGVLFSTVVSQQDGSRFNSCVNWGHFYVELACTPSACVGFLQVLLFPPTVQGHGDYVNWPI